MTDEVRMPEDAPESDATRDVPSGTASPPADSVAEPAGAEVVDAEVVAIDEPGSELDRARAEAAAHLEDARRIKAEFENYRKRVTREQASLADRGAAALVDRLLPVLDAFRLALLAADRTKDYDGLVRGVELVYGELLDAMRREGVEEIEADGKPFDPSVHEAVMETEGGDPGGEPFVVDVLRTGYRFKGQVLRPAMVKVERR